MIDTEREAQRILIVSAQAAKSSLRPTVEASSPKTAPLRDGWVRRSWRKAVTCDNGIVLWRSAAGTPKRADG